MNATQKSAAVVAVLAVSGLALWFWHDNYDRTGFGLSPKDMRSIQLTLGQSVPAIKGIAYWGSLPDPANPEHIKVCGILRSDWFVTTETAGDFYPDMRSFTATYDFGQQEVSKVVIGDLDLPQRAVADECNKMRGT